MGGFREEPRLKKYTTSIDEGSNRRILLAENLKARIVGGEGRRACLTPLQLETRFWGQNYLDLVQGGVQGL